MARKKEYCEDDHHRNKYTRSKHSMSHTSSRYGHGGYSTPSKSKKGDPSELNDNVLMSQLAKSGLTIKEMPGDGNCLFRSLADQLEGHPRNHEYHRKAVVQYMRENREDFEPFVEDDVPFEKYVQDLSQPGTFAGNDAIVAFARLHNVTVVIHQVNSPAWIIHPYTSKDHRAEKVIGEIHIAYHNGEHYNSVRRIGDYSEDPANIRTLSPETSKDSLLSRRSQGNKICLANSAQTVSNDRMKKLDTHSSCDGACGIENFYYGNRDEDYWVKDSNDIEPLVDDLSEKFGHLDKDLVRKTLLECHFNIELTIDKLCSKNPPQPSKGGVNQSPDVSEDNKDLQVEEVGSSEKDAECSKSEDEASVRLEGEEHGSVITSRDATSQDMIDSSKQSIKKMSARKKKDLKKQQRKLNADQRKRKDSAKPSTTLNLVTNLKSLNI